MTLAPTSIITRFCQDFKLTLELPEHHHWVIDNYELYGPEHEIQDDLTKEGRAWDLYELITIPGRHTLSNGDPGYPDEVDVRPIGSHPTLFAALEAIGQRVISTWLDAEQRAAAMPDNEP